MSDLLSVIVTAGGSLTAAAACRRVERSRSRAYDYHNTVEMCWTGVGVGNWCGTSVELCWFGVGSSVEIMRSVCGNF